MGASNSKEEPVYVYSNSVPIGFTPQLKEKLVKDATEKQNQAQNRTQTQTNPDPAKFDSTDLQDKVEGLVAKELARILEKNQLDDLQARDRNASTTELLSDIRDVARQIAASTSTRSPTYEESLRARDRVAACLADNAGRPLDCWSHVAEFKALAKTLEAEFAAGAK
ncbi:hypothetical protein BX661DRAFT_188671 [Kickxella alabastrina]|uniref:uncharacterized protein n=1 Tax=Kickxella alabastrina TaxID=61397 RepID=UPI002220CB00|nr:uncharacterized protein BX661DRAFT_188671 [Kickxella alabastrina]KAI7821136.1 hypothetical protein BX661DRAFT_188671 [Kickxella alabastrina]